MKIFDYELKDVNGDMVTLEKYKGKALLIVNTATGCGLTPQYEGLQKLYDKYKDNGLVIVNLFGNILHPSNFTKRIFKPLLNKVGIDRSFRFHDLRHTHASQLLMAGVNPKIVQERLGHSTIAMTLNTYSHLLPSMQEEAVKALEQKLREV